MILQPGDIEGIACVCSVFGNLLTIDISALPATVNTRYIDVCGGNCPYVEYLDMLQFVTEGLCNASCFANEVNWAASYLMQPVNVSACDLGCQQQHEAFMSQSQFASLPASAPEASAISSQHRKLQQLVWYQAPYADCHSDSGELCAPQEEEAGPACWEDEPDCKNCPDPANQHPEIPCWYGVYVDDSGTPDSRFCSNCADYANMNAAANAASNSGGNSGKVNVGQVVTGVLQVLIALG